MWRFSGARSLQEAPLGDEKGSVQGRHAEGWAEVQLDQAERTLPAPHQLCLLRQSWDFCSHKNPKEVV